MSANGTRPARAAAYLALALLAVVGIGAQERSVPALLNTVSAPAERLSAVESRPETVNAETVTVNRAAMAADVLDLALTGGVVVRAELDRRDALGGGAEAWSGHVPGAPMSSVTLVAMDGVLQGSIRTLDATWSIEPSADGPLHVVRQIDGSALPRELPPLEAPASPEALAANPSEATADDGGTIDVLVLYTPGARTSAGGSDAAVQTRIALGISETNTGYANSGITPRLRLVGTQVLSYTEVGMSADLSALQSNASVGSVRNAVGADLVALVVANSAEACGIGYLLNGSAAYGFSVTSYNCISPNYSFGHELGHNMGSAHAPEDGGSGFYAYSHGYKHPSNLFRTVMAYDCPGGCPRVLHFSNPDVNYGGAPTGTGAQHDNARSIDQTANTVANFRQAVGGGTAPTISSIGNTTVAEDAATAPIGFTIDDAETAASGLIVTAASANTALVPNTAAALALGGSGASRTLVVTPVANQHGAASITVTVSDGALTASRTFTLTVTPVNDAPTISRSPVSASILTGTSTQTSVTIADIDSAGTALSLSTSSSNPVLLPNANVTFAVTSTGANSRSLQVTMTPVAGQSGSATVTLAGADGTSTATTTFALTVTAPLPPTVSSPGPQTTAEDTPIAVPFTVGDSDTPLASLLVQTSSSNTTLVPAAGLALSGSGASRTLTITPAANLSGGSTITLSVGDGSTTTSITFALTVTAVSDPPVYAAGVPAAVSTVVSTATSFQVTVTDVDTAGAALGLTGTTTNAAVLANSGILIAPVSSTASSRTFSVTLTPVAGATGTGGAVLSATDGQTSVGRTVQLSVTATPAAPDAPTTLTASAGPGLLDLAWTPATTGSAPASYVVSVGTSAGATTLPIQTTTSTSIAIPITIGATYYARVQARNAYGDSVPSPEAVATVTVPNGRPGRPSRPRVWTSGRTVSMDWDAPLDGDPVTRYTLEVGSAPGLANLVVAPLSTSRSFAAGGVPDGTFWLRVRGENGYGIGDPSEDVGLVMGPAGGCVGLPLAPGSLGSSVAGSIVSLAWSAPVSGVTPTGYVLYAGSAPGRADLVTFSTGSTVTGWSGAAPPGVYHVRVAARTACGVGPLSNEVAVAVGATAPPAAPESLTSIVVGRTISLSWSPPPSGPAPGGYVLEVGSSSTATDVARIELSAVTTISGAVPPGRYFLRVRARAGGVTGAPSNEVDVVVP